MSITFTGTVRGTRIFGDYANVSIDRGDSFKFGRFVKAKFPMDKAPELRDGMKVSVTFDSVPEAEGYTSKKTRADGSNYINGVVVFYAPDIKPLEDISNPGTFEDDIPF